jgi:hypothetical protein
LGGKLGALAIKLPWRSSLVALAVKFSLSLVFLLFAVNLVVKFVCLYKEGTRQLLRHCYQFTAAEFTAYCADEEIQRHYFASYSPQQNGVLEHRNQTVVATTRTLLKQRGMPAEFWGEAVMTAVHLLNQSSTKSLEGKTPYEA